ncbi:aspartate transaminase AAT1 Ecym_7397 [Eremothecium cymbalariae DBVPG|uniref:Aminotransferase class I/classII large domain-containing protein n=1 Tax=Eremothecium cymbalariae (strain CBS 270.75 / DBVPG 7215 / KCTC 17166 / NRRL Y-17582) TaxID=931890 RepID=G8JWK8_ERECY|nr:hypothetical protein Ecym_7397 [Eremothecium cymbalariae DBVPG\
MKHGWRPSFVASIVRSYYHTLSRIPNALPDKILGLTEVFNKDTNPQKVNLTVGIYRDDLGLVTNFKSVVQAQSILSADMGISGDWSYLPIAGCPEYSTSVMDFLFKESVPQAKSYLESDKISFVQSLSGTGALAIATRFLTSFISKVIWVPDPSWGNHMNIFDNNGFKEVRVYKYYKDGSIDIDGWLDQLRQAKSEFGSRYPHCILLQACCHNPTGVDPTRTQWKKALEVINELGLIPVIDMAYQGLESGDLIEDAYLLRMCLEHNWRNGLYICQSFAKNMGLYSERIGSLSVIHPMDESNTKAKADSQLKRIVRGVYSSPPSYGSRIATLVLNNPTLKAQWFEDVKKMTDRLWSVRVMLYERLKWDTLIDRTTQHGMFYYSGFSPKQVDILRRHHSIYLTQDGRISLAGINRSNIDHVAQSFLSVSRCRLA